MQNRKTLIQLLALGPVVFIPTVVLIVASLITSTEKAGFERAITQVEQDFLENEKARVRSKVNNMVDLVTYRQSIINQQLHNRIQRRVDDAQRVALTLYEKYHNELPEKAVKQLIVEALRPLTWNGGESYIWIIDFDGDLQLAPGYLKHLEGSSFIDFKDATGREIIREEISIAQGKGQGFLWDTFTKPGEPTEKQFKQLAFVKKLGVFDWYLGSGEYLDTATKLTNTHLLEAINQMGKGDSDYFYVIDTDGNLLLNYARPDIVGKNMSETTDPNLHGLYRKIVQASKSESEDFISYNWLNPSSGMVDVKMAYVRYVPISRWVIGSGFYPKTLERGYGVQKQRLINQHKQKMRHLNTLTWLSVVVALLIAAFMSVLFHRILGRYQQELVDDNNELKDLNLELENKVIMTSQALDKANEKLEGLSVKDNLTNLPNRFVLLQRLEAERERANRFNEAFSVIMFDVDFFKKVNDKCGHETGDKTIQHLARLVDSKVRTVDLLGRLGSEEFLIIMPNTTANEALESAERIRQAIEQEVFECDASITVSMGVAEHRKSFNVADILKVADVALYQAKAQGRNRVCSYEDE